SNTDRIDYEYGIDGQLASTFNAKTQRREEFLWDGLALIARGENNYLNEPAITGGNPILAFSKDSSKVLFDDMLGNTVGSLEDGKFSAINRTAFGESNSDSELNFFTGKPQVKGLGYAFMFRNYRADQGKWQTADPMGYPDGWNNLAYVNNRANSNVDPLGLCREVTDYCVGDCTFLPPGSPCPGHVRTVHDWETTWTTKQTTKTQSGQDAGAALVSQCGDPATTQTITGTTHYFGGSIGYNGISLSWSYTGQSFSTQLTKPAYADCGFGDNHETRATKTYNVLYDVFVIVQENEADCGLKMYRTLTTDNYYLGAPVSLGQCTE
ncbi:MAG: RHS repeat-associated core domain-containing protein, partial [Victivallaceae bacterium]